VHQEPGQTGHVQEPLEIDGKRLELHDVVAVARSGRSVRLAAAARRPIAASRQAVERIVDQDEPIYGVTTGFGALSDRLIPPEQTRALQINLLRSHATGAGDPLPVEVVRAAMLLRANSLARGCSGVRPILVETLLAHLNAGIHPVVPQQGSLGASGDLAPLAHLALPLTGFGTVEIDGRRIDAGRALNETGILPLALEPKEALALINGTQIMAALATLALLDAERLVASAISIAALSCCALAARRTPFDERIHAVRPHPGQVTIALTLRALLAGVPEVPLSVKRIQDPYSLRCVPQVYGAVRDALQPLRATLEVEVNAATDNPLVFDDGVVLSGGNFHGHPLALGCDAAKTAVASLGTIVERRIALLVDGEERGLPACLAPEPGLDSGYMVAHYLAAGLVAENRVLAHPASVDSISTSANVEDYNSMGALAARHFRQIVANVEQIVAVEALCAAQACDLSGRVPTGPLGVLHARIRATVPILRHDDRVVADDVAAVRALLRDGRLIALPEASEGE
jgi:histidine ammonia-lyase